MSLMRCWAGSWLLITTPWTTSLLHLPTCTDHSTSCGFLWSFPRSWERCRSLRGIFEPWWNIWNSFSGFWQSSMRIFSLSPHMCPHQRPTTTWNNRGQFTEGDLGHFISFPCFSVPWPVWACTQRNKKQLSLRYALLDHPFFFSGLTLGFPLLSCETSCFYHATNPQLRSVCGTVLHVKPPHAALLQQKSCCALYCSKGMSSAISAICWHALPVCRPQIRWNTWETATADGLLLQPFLIVICSFVTWRTLFKTRLRLWRPHQSSWRYSVKPSCNVFFPLRY